MCINGERFDFRDGRVFLVAFPQSGPTTNMGLPQVEQLGEDPAFWIDAGSSDTDRIRHGLSRMAQELGNIRLFLDKYRVENEAAGQGQ
jgi:hypothetical protein